MTLHDLLRWFRREPTVAQASFMGFPPVIYDIERMAYQVGFAQGELSGRMKLAAELEQQLGVEGGAEVFTADDAARIRVRQVH